MSDNEKDWFERAVEDGDDSAGDAEGTDRDDDWFERSAGDADSSDQTGGARVDGADDGSDGESGPDPDADPDNDVFADLGGEFDAREDRTRPPDDADDVDEGLFEEDFAAALDDADVPSGGGPGGGGGGPPGGEFDAVDDPGGGGGPPGGEFDVGGGEDFGMGGGGDFGMGGGEDFGMGGGGDFGMGGGFGDVGGEEFEEELDTDLDRIDLGIEGLDEMIQGGVPRRSLMVAIGSAGTGKTTFGIQFLNEEFEREDPGRSVFITLEESRERIVNSATEKGYPFDEYLDEGRLAIVDIDPIEMANSLATIRSELPRLIREFNANRLVLDSVSLLEMMYDNRATRRNEIYDFTKSLKRAGVTTMLTSEANQENPYASRYGIVEYLTDAVFVLQYVRPSDFRKTRLAIEIQKIRDANHSRETKPYEITGDGISVYRQANIF